MMVARLVRWRRHNPVDVGGNAVEINAIDMNRNRRNVAGVTKAMNLFEPGVPGTRVSWKSRNGACVSRAPGAGVPRVTLFIERATEDMVGTPRMVCMHGAKLPRLPNDRYNGEPALRVTVQQVACVACCRPGTGTRQGSQVLFKPRCSFQRLGHAGWHCIHRSKASMDNVLDQSMQGIVIDDGGGPIKVRNGTPKRRFLEKTKAGCIHMAHKLIIYSVYKF